LLSYLKKERPKLLLDETTDEDLVRTNCFWLPKHPRPLLSDKSKY